MQGELVACLDYNGSFSLLDSLRENTNPFLHHNKESIFDRPLHTIIRKFEVLEDGTNLLMMTMRGSLIQVKITLLTEESSMKDHLLSKMIKNYSMMQEDSEDVAT